MKPDEVTVECMSEQVRNKYWLILSAVFSAIDPVSLRAGVDSLSRDTLFCTIESEGMYSSVLFVTPVTLAGIRLGGIGGVCTREEYRGRGYGRLIMERVLRDSAEVYGALLLWTRIPAYFQSFGFIEMPELFISDPHGSAPMFFFHDRESRMTISALTDLSRDYF
jgi:GNAT superfamily N-acetyltransferase